MPKGLPKVEAEIHADLKPLLNDLKETDPALARAFRRRLRASGDSTISLQRKILAMPSPGVVVKAGRAPEAPRGTKRRRGGQRKFLYETRAARGSQSRGSRKAVANSLRTAVSTPKKGMGSVTIRAKKHPFARPYNTRRFRHPVFGERDEWITQAGRPWFQEAIYSRIGDWRSTIESALDDARKELDSR